MKQQTIEQFKNEDYVKILFKHPELGFRYLPAIILGWNEEDKTVTLFFNSEIQIVDPDKEKINFSDLSIKQFHTINCMFLKYIEQHPDKPYLNEFVYEKTDTKLKLKK